MTILRLTSELALERAKASASSSSKNMTQGFWLRALSNISARLRSLSPCHIDRISAMPMARKLALHSFATARASIVLPQPGGP